VSDADSGARNGNADARVLVVDDTEGNRYAVTVSDQPSVPETKTFLQALAVAGVKYRTCTARVVDVTDDAHPAPVNAKEMSVVHSGLACIKFR